MPLEESLKKVFGFINRDRLFFPAQLITVVEAAGIFYGVYPGGDYVAIVDGSDSHPIAKEKFSLRDSFISCSQNIESTDFEALISFGISADHILTGTMKEVIEGISREIDLDQHTGEELEILMEAHRGYEEFLANKSQGLKPETLKL